MADFVEKHGVKIKVGDFVKCLKFAFASCVGEIEKCTGVVNENGDDYIFVKDGPFGAKNTYVKVVEDEQQKA